jgi:hypothetical protein
MTMAFKRIRTGRFTHLGWFPFYRYEDRNGVHTSIGIDHCVQVVVTVQDGPDKGREIRMILTQDEAKAHAYAVMAARTKAAEKEREEG